MGKRVTSALTYYPNSLEEITNMMKENLELIEPQMTKTFSFDANEDYTSKVYGKGLKGGNKLELMPSLIGDSVDDAKRWGQSKGISVSFNYEDSNGTTIIAQSSPKGTLLKNIKSVTFTVGSDTPKVDNTTEQEETTEE